MTAGPEVADLVVAEVTALPGVTRMHAGMYGEVATYLPGRRVVGVRVLDDAAHVHVVATWDAALPQLSRDIQHAVAPIVGTDVHVSIEDVDTPADRQRPSE